MCRSEEKRPRYGTSTIKMITALLTKGMDTKACGRQTQRIPQSSRSPGKSLENTQKTKDIFVWCQRYGFLV